MRRVQPAECHVLAQIGNETVGHVARHRHEVGAQSIRAVHDRLHETAPDGRPDVQIAELYDAKAGEVARQVGDGHRHAHDARPPRRQLSRGHGVRSVRACRASRTCRVAASCEEYTRRTMPLRSIT